MPLGYSSDAVALCAVEWVIENAHLGQVIVHQHSLLDLTQSAVSFSEIGRNKVSSSAGSWSPRLLKKASGADDQCVASSAVSEAVKMFG